MWLRSGSNQRWAWQVWQHLNRCFLSSYRISNILYEWMFTLRFESDVYHLMDTPCMRPVRTVTVLFCTTCAASLRHTFRFCFCLGNLARKPIDRLPESLIGYCCCHGSHFPTPVNTTGQRLNQCLFRFAGAMLHLRWIVKWSCVFHSFSQPRVTQMSHLLAVDSKRRFFFLIVGSLSSIFSCIITSRNIVCCFCSTDLWIR